MWDLLLPQTKSFDSIIQQETSVKAASNVTKILNKLNQEDSSNEEICKQDIQSCMDMGMESLAFMAQYNKMKNLKRKEYQKFDLSPQYHHLFSASVLFTDQLYGDNACQKSKEIQDMNRLSRQRNNRGRGAFGRDDFQGGRGGFARSRGYYRGGRGNRVGRGRGGQAQLTILSGNNQSQRNSTNSKNSRNLLSYQRK